MDRDIIIGIHSIAEALKNSLRSHIELIATEEGVDELKKRGNISREQLTVCPTRLVSSHKLQEEAKRLYQELDYNFQRIPSGVILVTSPIEILDPSIIYQRLERNEIIKIFCLDQVTDIHNAAAIMRTAAFYGVDYIVVSIKGNFGMGPNFARIASGALEYVKIVRCSSLPKFLAKVKTLGVLSIGFSEHTNNEDNPLAKNGNVCLVMGAEDVGLSHAVDRVVDKKVAFIPKGKIKSLNVSVASAIAMEMFWK